MNRIKSILGYTVAIIAIFISLATFIGNEYFGQKLIATTGLTVSPWITGGKVVQSIDHGDYKTEIHQTVMQGLFSEKDEGFVQIDWVKIKSIPDEIAEDIDFNNDGTVDFKVDYNTIDNAAKIVPINPNVISLGEQYKLKNSVVIRVRINR